MSLHPNVKAVCRFLLKLWICFDFGSYVMRSKGVWRDRRDPETPIVRWYMVPGLGSSWFGDYQGRLSRNFEMISEVRVWANVEWMSQVYSISLLTFKLSWFSCSIHLFHSNYLGGEEWWSALMTQRPASHSSKLMWQCDVYVDMILPFWAFSCDHVLALHVSFMSITSHFQNIPAHILKQICKIFAKHVCQARWMQFLGCLCVVSLCWRSSRIFAAPKITFHAVKERSWVLPNIKSAVTSMAVYQHCWSSQAFQCLRLQSQRSLAEKLKELVTHGCKWSWKRLDLYRPWERGRHRKHLRRLCAHVQYIDMARYVLSSEFIQSVLLWPHLNTFWHAALWYCSDYQQADSCIVWYW